MTPQQDCFDESSIFKLIFLIMATNCPILWHWKISIVECETRMLLLFIIYFLFNNLALQRPDYIFQRFLKDLKDSRSCFFLSSFCSKFLKNPINKKSAIKVGLQKRWKSGNPSCLKKYYSFQWKGHNICLRKYVVTIINNKLKFTMVSYPDFLLLQFCISKKVFWSNHYQNIMQRKI